MKKKIANVLTELSIGYPASPLNGGGEYVGAGPKEGERAPVDIDHPCAGAGDIPRFALYADESVVQRFALIKKYPDLLEPILRVPFEQGGLWLVRPDGAVAVATRQGRWDEIERYLDRLTGGMKN